MPIYSLTVETTSNATAGAAAWAIQMLMPASRDARLIAVTIKPQQLTNTQQSGRWVVDRISAVATGSALTPLKMNPYSGASDITDATITISTTLACAPTAANSAIVDCLDGWNDYRALDIRAGANQGFAVRRATAPTGAQVVNVTLYWEEL